MKASFSKILLGAVAIAAIAAPGLAHRNWLMPSATTFSGTDAWVTVDSAESTDVFYADHRANALNGIKVWAPDGSEGRIQNGASGRVRSTFDVQLDKPGTWRIGTEMNRLSGTFKVNGEDWRLGGRFGGGQGGPGGAGNPSAPRGAGGPEGQAGPAGLGRPGGQQGGRGAEGGPGRDGPPVKSVATIAEIPADATDVKLTEMSGRNEIFVTTGEPTTNLFAPKGKGLEMVPITHPDELVSNEDASFRYLIDGKPAAGLKVVILPAGKRYIEGQDEIDLTTDAGGVLKIKWPRAGMYWIGTTATDQHPTEPRASERRMSYTMTVDVLAP